MAIHTMKGNTPRGHDHRARWTEMFDTSVSDTGTMEIGPMFNLPADTLEAIGGKRVSETFSPDEVVAFEVSTRGAMLFEDSLGTCRFNTQTDVVHLVQAVNAATGWDLTGYGADGGEVLSRRVWPGVDRLRFGEAGSPALGFRPAGSDVVPLALDGEGGAAWEAPAPVFDLQVGPSVGDEI